MKKTTIKLNGNGTFDEITPSGFTIYDLDVKECLPISVKFEISNTIMKHIRECNSEYICLKFKSHYKGWTRLYFNRLDYISQTKETELCFPPYGASIKEFTIRNVKEELPEDCIWYKEVNDND